MPLKPSGALTLLLNMSTSKTTYIYFIKATKRKTISINLTKEAKKELFASY